MAEYVLILILVVVTLTERSPPASKKPAPSRRPGATPSG
jgi:hypothetical protein